MRAFEEKIEECRGKLLAAGIDVGEEVNSLDLA